ncbi:MAG: ABC transporter permease, partial [Candidatus Cloacimonetes bacterium]|nr:ABC transporter permease [Candidatus Cloacimonadota bacterium]
MAISIKESISIGLKDILTRKIRSVVTIIGIILGVMSIIVVLAIVGGMNTATLAWMQERGGLNKIEVEKNWAGDRRDWNLAYFTLNEIRYLRAQLPEAKAVNPTISLNWQSIRQGDIVYTADAFGVMPDLLDVEEWSVSQGRFLNDLDINHNNNVVVLGSKLATELFAEQNPIGQY